VKINPLHKRVVDAYFADPEMNKTRAYMTVYTECSGDSARSSAAALFALPSVDAYLQERMQKRADKAEVNQEWVLKELAKLAGFDPRKLFDDDGSIKLVRDWDDDTAACVSEIHVNEIFGGSGDQKQAIGLAKKINTRDKVKALELLGKHLGMFKERVEHSGSVTVVATKHDEAL